MSTNRRSLGDLRERYFLAYVDLVCLPTTLPDDEGRLQARLQQGRTRGVVVDVGGPLLRDASDGLEAGWAVVQFDERDSQGIDDELLPLEILQLVPGLGRANADVLTRSVRGHGQMLGIVQGGDV